ncbi:hypothetical protein QWY87_13845 [Lutimonas halocynthiae]|uniref:hypothetical protein n=1 Tax=Lutimonas halocynthiae TaxID=1446477 RepID=UPI0025B33F2F|nr:hypothetical protein [Lutimonas halocynthiae]MDN3643795.1 hypothetical protein [Lutimonas halocynthiae]
MDFIGCFNDFITVLNKHKVRYVILRGYENLPENFSNDLDFGIHPLDKDAFFSALKEYKIEHNLEIKINLSRYEVLKLRFSFKSQEIDFDFWFDINYCGLEYISISEVLRNAVPYKNFMIPSAADELTISFLKELLHMKRLREDKVVWLTSKVEESDLGFFATFFSKIIRKQFINVIKIRKFDLEKLSSKAKVELLKVHLKKRSFKATFQKIISFVYLRFRNNKNPLVIKLRDI